MRQRLEFSIDVPAELTRAAFPPFLLLSLVENAIRHGLEPLPEGGRITISARQIDDNKARFTVSVADTGVGLGGSIGNGVGLNNIRDQLRLRYADQARLTLVARQGRRSTCQHRVAAGKSQGVIVMNRVRVLIAEDEAAQREQLTGLIAKLWPEAELVAVCEDGDAALAALKSQRPDVLFLDIRMPGASGLDVARAASGRAHVVLTTAYEQYAVKAFEAGALDYLLKAGDC